MKRIIPILLILTMMLVFVSGCASSGNKETIIETETETEVVLSADFLYGIWSYEDIYDGEPGMGWSKGDKYKGVLEFYEGGTGRFKSTNLVSDKGTDLPTTWEIKDGNIVNVTYSSFGGGDVTFGLKVDLAAETLTRVDDNATVYTKE